MTLEDELWHVESAAVQARAQGFLGLAEAFDRVAGDLKGEVQEALLDLGRAAMDVPVHLSQGGHCCRAQA